MTKRRSRAPEETRQKILAAAFQEFHLQGFRAASLDTIAARAGVTKGALYHHFPEKAALGYAVVEDVVREPLIAAYVQPVHDCDGDPLTALQEALRRRADDFETGGVELGCPLNNLAQEMSPLDEDFRAAVAGVLEDWTGEFEHALDQAQARGHVRADVDTRRVAAFMVAAVEGSFGVAKNALSVELLRSNLEVLAEYLETLRN